MLYFTALNYSSEEVHDDLSLYRMCFSLELFLIAMNIPIVFAIFYLLHSKQAYHTNLTSLIVGYVVQYPFSIAARLVIIYFQMSEDFTQSDESVIFEMATIVRTFCAFTAFVTLPFFIMERLFATYYLNDYEHKSRKFIPVSLSLVLYSTSVGLTAIYILELVSVLIVISTMLLLNILSSLVGLWNVSHNRYLYSECRRVGSNRNYTLSQRFQISENINASQMINKALVAIVFFNIACGSVLLIQSTTVSDRYKNWAYLAMDLVFVLYGIVTPVLALWLNDTWLGEVLRITTKLQLGTVGRLVRKCLPSVTPTNSLGEKFEINNVQTQNDYFSELQNTWK